MGFAGKNRHRQVERSDTLVATGVGVGIAALEQFLEVKLDRSLQCGLQLCEVGATKDECRHVIPNQLLQVGFVRDECRSSLFFVGWDMYLWLTPLLRLLPLFLCKGK